MADELPTVEFSAAPDDLAADRVAERLALYDEALAQGRPLSLAPPSSWSAGEVERWEKGIALLHRLRPAPADPEATRDPAVADTVANPAVAALPEQIGRFRIEKELGRGGMGVVYQAWDPLLERLVAIKLLHQVDDHQQARLIHEAGVLAKLSHPNIVGIYEIGLHAEQPFLVMELVTGPALRAHRDDILSPAEATRLLVPIARAIQHAHDQGVIHRDLKPSNILLTDQGQPRVTDFGLAKQDQANLELTATGAILGTPSYMAPEQARADSAQIGPRTDIYGLGAMLYSLLVGRPPFYGLIAYEVLHQVLHEEPVAPRRLDPAIPLDLETICLKCLQKDPDRRYDRAADLADDLERFQRGEPIRARPISTLERTRRWVGRNPVLSALLATIALLLIAGTTTATLLAWWALDERNRANTEKALAIGHANEAQTQRIRADDEAERARDNEKTAIAARIDAETNQHRAETALYAGLLAYSYREWQDGNLDRAQYLLETTPWHLRGPEYRYVYTQQNHLGQRILRGHAIRITGVDAHPSGQWLASSGSDQSIRLWDLAGGEQLRQLRDGVGPVNCVRYSPDGRFLASGHHDRVVRIWDGADFTIRHRLKEHTAPIAALCWSPDSKRLASAAGDRTVRLWDIDQGTLLHTLPGHSPGPVTMDWHPEGKYLLTASSEQPLRRWDTATGKEVPGFAAIGPVVSLHFSPDGSHLATLQRDGTLHLRNAQTGEELARQKPHTIGRAVRFSPDGLRLATTGGANLASAELFLWDRQLGSGPLRLRGHWNEITDLTFTPDGRQLVSANADLTLRIWDATRGGEPMTLPRGHSRAVLRVRAAADGRHAVSAGQDGVVQLWDLDTGRIAQSYFAHRDQVHGAELSPDGQRLLTASRDRTLRLWNAATSAPLATLEGHAGPVLDVRWHPSGRLAVSVSEDKTARIWDVSTGVVLHTLTGHPEPIRTAGWSPDGKLLLTGCRGGVVKLWETETGKLIRTQAPQKNVIESVDFHPDGDRYLTACQDRTLSIWSTATGAERVTLRGHTNPVMAGRYTADGRRIISAGSDRTVKVWDPETGLELFTFGDGGTEYLTADITPDGRRLIAGGVPSTLRVWDLSSTRIQRTLRLTSIAQAIALRSDGQQVAIAGLDGKLILCDANTGQETRSWQAHQGRALSVAYSTDGKTLATAGDDFQLRLWDTRTGQELRSLRDHHAWILSLQFSADGKRLLARAGDRIWAWEVATGKPLPTEGLQPPPPDGPKQMEAGGLVATLEWTMVSIRRKEDAYHRIPPYVVDRTPPSVYHHMRQQEARGRNDRPADFFHLVALARLQPWDAYGRDQARILGRTAPDLAFVKATRERFAQNEAVRQARLIPALLDSPWSALLELPALGP